MKHIYLDKYFLFFLLIIILTGNFNYFIPYFLLLLFHELAHAVTGILLGYKLEKIIFYPLGGITIINYPINIPLIKELLILIMGPIIQIIVYLLIKDCFPFIKVYHYTLLIFNLLPIYPLDGGKILNILSGYVFNYLTCFNISIIVSIIMFFVLIIYNIYYFNLNLVFMIILLISKIYRLYKNKYLIYNRFLLERYMYQFHFKRIKNVNSINKLYRDHFHYINFIKEKDLLNNMFKSK